MNFLNDCISPVHDISLLLFSLLDCTISIETSSVHIFMFIRCPSTYFFCNLKDEITLFYSLLNLYFPFHVLLNMFYAHVLIYFIA